MYCYGVLPSFHSASCLNAKGLPILTGADLDRPSGRRQRILRHSCCHQLRSSNGPLCAARDTFHQCHWTFWHRSPCLILDRCNERCCLLRHSPRSGGPHPLRGSSSREPKMVRRGLSQMGEPVVFDWPSLHHPGPFRLPRTPGGSSDCLSRSSCRALDRLLWNCVLFYPACHL